MSPKTSDLVVYHHRVYAVHNYSNHGEIQHRVQVRIVLLRVNTRSGKLRRRIISDERAHGVKICKANKKFFRMAKGRCKTHKVPKFSGADQLALIERAERDIQRRSAQRQVDSLQQQITKGGLTGRQKTLIISGNDDKKIVYTKVDEIPSFSVQELLQSIGVEGIDMSSDLNPGVDVETMASRLSENMDEEPSKFRIYMRDSINYANFAMLQHLVETMYLPRQLEELQGWIMHHGSIFIMGGAGFDFRDSVQRCKEAITRLEDTWSHTLIASDPSFTTPTA